MKAQISQKEILKLVADGKVTDMNGLYAKMMKKGKNAVAPLKFVAAIEAVCGSDTFNVEAAKLALAPKKRKPKDPNAIVLGIRLCRRAVKAGATDHASLQTALGTAHEPEAFAAALAALFPEGDAFYRKSEKVKGKRGRPANPNKPPKAARVVIPKTKPFVSATGIVSDYQKIVDFCIEGGGNGMAEVALRKALVEQGICSDEVKAWASLSVVRNPKQLSNRGRTQCSNLTAANERGADGKWTDAAKALRAQGLHKVVQIEILSLVPTMTDRHGNEAPAPAAATESSDTIEATTSDVTPVEATTEVEATTDANG